jgi:hypothetical protein
MPFIEHPKNTFWNLSDATKATYTPQREKPRSKTPEELVESPGPPYGTTDIILSSLILKFHVDGRDETVTLKGSEADRVHQLLQES